MIINYKKKYANELLTFQKKKLYYNRQSQINFVYPFSIFLGVLYLLRLQMHNYLVGLKLKHSFILMFLILLFYGQTAIIGSDFGNYIQNYGQSSIDIGSQVKVLPRRDSDRTSFMDFKKKHNKRYGNSQEEVFRSLIFMKNRQYINLHNSNTSRTYNMAINSFTDMTSSQFNQIYSATIKSDQKIKNLTRSMLTYNKAQSAESNTLNIKQSYQLKNHIQILLQQRTKYHQGCDTNQDDLDQLRKQASSNFSTQSRQRSKNILYSLNKQYGYDQKSSSSLSESSSYLTNKPNETFQQKLTQILQQKVNQTLQNRIEVNQQNNNNSKINQKSQLNLQLNNSKINVQTKELNTNNINTYQSSNYKTQQKCNSTLQQNSYSISQQKVNSVIRQKSTRSNKGYRNLQTLSSISNYYSLSNILPLKQTFVNNTLTNILSTISNSTNSTSTISSTSKTTTATNSIVQNGNFSANTVDWTVHAGKVRYQGICGACYTFATSDALGALYSIYKYGFFVSLSTQQVIDCSTNGLTYGCNGGFLQSSYAYMQTKGIQTDYNYPYTSASSGMAGTCKKQGGAFKISSFKNIQQGNCRALVNQLNYGPISVGIAGYRLQFYSQGIFNDCNNYIDHAVVLISYKGGVGWKIKNSWGSDWGMKGFAWIADGNNCGICNMAVSAKL